MEAHGFSPGRISEAVVGTYSGSDNKSVACVLSIFLQVLTAAYYDNHFGNPGIAATVVVGYRIKVSIYRNIGSFDMSNFRTCFALRPLASPGYLWRH